MVIVFRKAAEPFEFDESRWFENEKPSVLEAFRVLAKEGYYASISLADYTEREARFMKHEDVIAQDLLKEAASQFNDALLDEQAKKIKRLGKEIAKLNGIIHDKNAVLADVAEELRLSKVREENLTEVCQKYLKEIEELREKLADKVVDKIDAQALKSAESALAWKEKAVTYKDMALAYYEKKIAEKDEVIADLGKELAATKKELEEKTKLVETVRKGSKEYCEYGIAAEKMIQKMAKEIVNDSPVPSKDYKQYRLWANGYRFNPQLPEFSEEETAKILDYNAKCMRAARESINDVFESYAAKYAKSSLDDLKEKAYELFNAKAHNLGLVGSKDGNGLLNQMAGADVAEEGADQSGKIVLCGKDFAKILKENEEAAEELFKVLDDVIEFMSVESKQLFEGDGIPTKMEVMEPSRKFKKIK